MVEPLLERIEIKLRAPASKACPERQSNGLQRNWNNQASTSKRALAFWMLEFGISLDALLAKAFGVGGWKLELLLPDIRYRRKAITCLEQSRTASHLIFLCTGWKSARPTGKMPVPL
jgi:hypothetical protein